LLAGWRGERDARPHRRVYQHLGSWRRER
jgi:hypothetical protein